MTQTAHQVETLDALNNLVEAVRGIEVSSNNKIDFDTDAYNLISWLGENLESIADSLKKIEAKMK